MPDVRPYRDDDAESCRALLETVLPAYGLKVDFDGTDRDLMDVRATYVKPGGAFWVIEDHDGSIAGMGGLERKGEHGEIGEVRKMYFLPELRGQGLGRAMLDRMTAFARENGIRTLTLETASVLKEAIRLYERYGFTPDPSLLRTKRCDLAYRLDLPPAT